MICKKVGTLTCDRNQIQKYQQLRETQQLNCSTTKSPCENIFHNLKMLYLNLEARLFNTLI